MIIDLRDYTTAPEKRDLLIERCEREFFPEQTRLGARFIGVFRDADNPDRFVWLRGIRLGSECNDAVGGWHVLARQSRAD